MWAKRLAVLFLILTLGVSVVSCAPSPTGAPKPTEAPKATEPAEVAEPEPAEAVEPEPEPAEVEVTGETPGERAVAALKAMNLEPGTEFTIYSEDLSIKMADVNVEEFNKQTGLVLKPMTAPFVEHRAKIMQDAMNKTGAYDMVILQWTIIGDLYNAGYLTPLTEWVEKYDPDLDDMVAPFNKVWSEYAGEVMGLPTDGDTWILYYRTDLFEDPDEQAAFTEKYGYDLAPPKTWDEFNDMAEFFTRPEDKLYGMAEWRAKGFVYPWFYQRLAGLGGSYFTEGMKPGINGPEGVQALEDLKEMNQWMSPDVLSFGYMETVTAFAQGQAAMLNTWPAAAKNIVNAEESEVVGKVGYTVTPGYVLDGELNQLTMTVPGYSIIVNAHTKLPPEAVYLVAQWLVSPEQLKRANLNLAGNTDVIRKSIFNDPEVREKIPGGGEYLDAQMANMAQGYPELVLPGSEEYSQVVEIEVSRYMTGETATAQEAVDNMAEEWERVTDKHGREKQEELYNDYFDSYYGEAKPPEPVEAEPPGEAPGERAVEALKAMNLEPGTEFTIYSEDLSIKMADVNVEEFNKQTGLVLKPMTAPFVEHRAKIMQDAMNKTGAYDMVILQWTIIGDLYNAGYLTPLTEWVEKYDPDLDDMVAPFNKVWSEYAGEVMGLPTDGDTWILYYRTDLFEDPDEQAAFTEKYGYDLAPPKTWDEFNDMAEFFTRPEDKLYGMAEWRAKGFVYPWFYQRLAGLGGSYFTEGMKPGINGPEGVQALEDLKEMNQWMSPDVLSFGYMETVTAFAQGQAAMLNTWPAAAKNIVNAEESEVVGKVGYTVTPGYVLDGELNQLTMTVPGYSIIVNAHTKLPPEAVYLVAQWLVSPEQLKRANLNLAGNTDVIRKSIFNDPEVREKIPGGGEYLDAQMANMAQGYPELVLPGSEEYSQVVEIEVSRYMTGETATAQEAVDNMAEEWERVTDKHGREKQEELYNDYFDSYYGN